VSAQKIQTITGQWCRLELCKTLARRSLPVENASRFRRLDSGCLDPERRDGRVSQFQFGWQRRFAMIRQL